MIERGPACRTKYLILDLLYISASFGKRFDALLGLHFRRASLSFFCAYKIAVEFLQFLNQVLRKHVNLNLRFLQSAYTSSAYSGVRIDHSNYDPLNISFDKPFCAR